MDRDHLRDERLFFSQLFYAFMNYHNCKPFFYFFFLGEGWKPAEAEMQTENSQFAPTTQPK